MAALPRGCKMLSFPCIADERGKLTFMEGENHIPFEIKRIFYLYGVGKGEQRGGHAHRQCEQVIIPLSGAFDVVLDDAEKVFRHAMDMPHAGMYVPAGVWVRLEHFSAGAIALVVCSEPYSEKDYIRKYEDFRSMKKK